MRRLLVWAPDGAGARIREAATRNGASNILTLEAGTPEGRVDALLVHLSNDRLDDFVGELDDIDDVHVSFFPQGALLLQPPETELPQEVTNVHWRSPLEVFLAAQQSIGSWRGFLAYAALSGVIVWVGLFTNTVFLLIAAMLIAPLAGPAMNAAIATARGDAHLLRHAVVRYVAALLATSGMAALLSVAFGQRSATELMVRTSTVSSVAVLLPLAAGAAGAVNLAQSARTSLVSGAATGMLIAAALAPPAGVLGMALVMGEVGMAGSVAFLLPLQLLAINLSGVSVFWLAGVRTSGARYQHGNNRVRMATLVVSVAGVVALVGWQVVTSPALQRATIESRAVADVQELIRRVDDVALVEVNTRFTRADIPGQQTLLVVAYVQSAAGDDSGAEQRALEQRVAQRIRAVLEARYPGVTPVVDVNVVLASSA